MTLTLGGCKTAIRASTSSSARWHLTPGDPTSVTLSTGSAGLGGGICAAHIEVGDGLDVAVTTRTATLLPRCDDCAEYVAHIEVADGAHLSYLPRVFIPFPGANARLSTRVDVSRGGSALCWDMLALGRIGHKETVSFEAILRRNEITHNGRVVVDETMLLAGDDAYPVRAMFVGYTHLGTMTVVAPVGVIDPCRIRDAIASSHPLRVGVSEPADGVILVRLLAHSSETIEQALWPVVTLIRRMLERSAISPRKIGRHWASESELSVPSGLQRPRMRSTRQHCRSSSDRLPPAYG